MQTSQKPLGQLLKEMELVTEGQIQEALMVQREKGGALGDIMVELAMISREDLQLALGAQLGMEVVNLREAEIPADVIARLPLAMAKVLEVIPIKFEKNTLVVAMANPHNVSVLDDLRFMLNCEAQGAISNGDDVRWALEKYYAGSGDNLDNVLKKWDSMRTDTPGASVRGIANSNGCFNDAIAFYERVVDRPFCSEGRQPESGTWQVTKRAETDHRDCR